MEPIMQYVISEPRNLPFEGLEFCSTEAATLQGDSAEFAPYAKRLIGVLAMLPGVCVVFSVSQISRFQVHTKI
jgi:hypothetical protein